jgi:antirestriction protein ArdC
MRALPLRGSGRQTRSEIAMDVYTVITERIIEKLNAGVVPWHKPWRIIGAPRNLVSKKPYRGVNVWLLTAQGNVSPYWATIRQINELGGSVRKGEKATPVVFWRVYVEGVELKTGEPEPESHETEGQGSRRFVLRYYSVFNSEQCELPAAIVEKLAVPEQRQLDPIEACEKILAGMPNPPEIVHAGDKAFYSPATDRVTMPPRSLFESAEEYWSTLWHECGGHATGHPKRLNRDSIKEAAPFGSATYSVEEIIAEMTAAYLCGVTGIENRTIDNSAAYIANWLKMLSADRKLIIRAAAQAQRACDYVLGRPCAD